MTEPHKQRSLFSFPAIPVGPPSRRNWYQELLDDPGCQNDPKKIQEAYESYRRAILSHSITEFRNLAKSISENIPTLITPDSALLQHLSRQTTELKTQEPFPLSPANCLVLWARPPSFILKLIESIQNGLYSLAGRDLYLIPLSHMHLSVMELSHRHPISDLRTVYNVVGEPLLRTMADLPFAKYKESQGRAVARLVRPQLMMDGVGVAVTFVPDDSPRDEIREGGAPDIAKSEPFTYHHLRASLQSLALSSGVETDSYYTSPSAHITIARFVSSHFFDGGPHHATSSSTPGPPTSEQQSSYSSAELSKRRSQKAEQWVELIHGINDELRKQGEDHSLRKQLSWVVGQENGLEVQLGYVKFGRDTDRAEIVGQALPSV